MKNQTKTHITLHMGQWAVSRSQEESLVSPCLGSCVALCLYSPENKIGAMAHVVLPNRNISLTGKNLHPYPDARYADEALTILLDEIFRLVGQKDILIKAKPFALGVRIEHPQSLIDSIQYHCPVNIGRDTYLPPASYQLVEQVNSIGVFSFCMCPGGIIGTASTSQNELVVNGWSPSKRNNPFANSGMVVQVHESDAAAQLKTNNKKHSINDPFILHQFQESVEKKAFDVGGGLFVAPAQRMTDFVNNKVSTTLPENSYLRGVHSTNLKTVLPPFIVDSLKTALVAFGKK